MNNSNINPEMTFKHLCYMRMQQLTNFPYIEKDFDALTDYELLSLVVKYLNDVIKNSNEQNESITNLYNAFITLQDNFNELHDYVMDYFANLDVQEEINNKLDKMLEDGVLEQIIEQFIQSTALWCFNTVADMKNATNFINGSYAKTLGYYSANDGGGANYKIRTKTEEDTPNDMTIIAIGESLVAELQYNNYEYLNPEMFGAKGDGTTDDTLAFQTMFDLAKPIKCELSNKVYGITNIDLKNKDIYLDGNNNTFLNVRYNMSSLPANIYTTSMFYLGVSNDGTKYKPNVIVKNATFDGNKDNLINLRAFWNAVFSIVYGNNINFENVHFKDTIGTANIITNANNYLIKDSTFNNIANRQDPALNGTSRNGYEIFVDDNTVKTIFRSENINGYNISDSYARCDGAYTTSLVNSDFTNVREIIEMHTTWDNRFPTYKKVNINGVNCESCGGLILYASSDDSSDYKGVINISNTKLNNLLQSGVTGGYISIEGIGSICNIDNSYIHTNQTSDKVSYGVIYGNKNSTINISNTTIDSKIMTKPIIGIPTNSKANIYINNSKLISSTTGKKIINTNNSNVGSNLYINNSYLEGSIIGQYDNLSLKDNIMNTGETPLENTIQGTKLELINNEINFSQSSGYPFNISQQPEYALYSNNRFLNSADSYVFFNIKCGTKLTKFDNNYMNFHNIANAFTIPANSKCSIHDNMVKSISFSGTAQIAHDNEGITITE